MSDVAAHDPRTSVRLANSPCHGSIYYLHPLLAGEADGWDQHFARCSEMGFSHVLLGPMFLPGQNGDIFLTADHGQADPRVGGGDFRRMLDRVVEQASRRNLSVLLDLVIDRVATGANLPKPLMRASESLPDPRGPSLGLGATSLDFAEHSDELVSWWQSRIGQWLDTGVAGIGCAAPERLPPAAWHDLIAGVRQQAAPCSFLAWTCNTEVLVMNSLAGVGFDMACSSSWAWDFRRDWLDADTGRVARIGAVTAMPEQPFGPRLARQGDGFGAASKRSVQFAAGFGQAWIMPMGFEYGAHLRMDPVRDCSADFAKLAEADSKKAVGFIAEANALHRETAALLPGRVISSPQADVAAVLRAGDSSAGRLLLTNASLDYPSVAPAQQLFPRAGDGLRFTQGATVQRLQDSIAVPPAGVAVLAVERSSAIAMPRRSQRGAESAIKEPRIAIEAVQPSVDNGRFPAKVTAGGLVQVSADIIVDGHPILAAMIAWRSADSVRWQEAPMRLTNNDRWVGAFPAERVGRHLFTIEAWVDLFATWRDEVTKKRAASANLDNEIVEGRRLLAEAADRTSRADLLDLKSRIESTEPEAQLTFLLHADTARLMAEADGRAFRSRYEPTLPVDAERNRAGFSAWYELFPRSQSGDVRRHGNFADVIARLPAVKAMGFDVLYMPPIHPIGQKNRKGPNNTLNAGPDDPGSPYAIGSSEGGHDAIHPQLGTLEDFRSLVAAAASHGMELALDFAIQCSPDHPWLREHPEWFEWRPDGSIRYAENPPKRYEDIVNVAFYAEGSLPSLWTALRDVVLFWVREGVRIFRVDNPHTKPLPFWEWMIGDVRGRYPDVMFLAEAFTRPKVMYRLAKVGFSQSYTYFTWRDTAFEMREYLTELTTTAPRNFFRPHFFVNTPDINPPFLQSSGRPGFLIRAALAATTSGLWGVYNGFELCDAAALPGREEYLNSEKYEIRAWDWNQPGNIIAEIRQLNAIRRANPALHSHLGIKFLPCSNDNILCFCKSTAELDNVLVIAISFDPRNTQAAQIEIPADVVGLAGNASLAVEDLLRGQDERWWTGSRQIQLDPFDMPFAIWRVRPEN